MSDLFTLALGYAMGYLWATRREYIKALAGRMFNTKKR